MCLYLYTRFDINLCVQDFGDGSTMSKDWTVVFGIIDEVVKQKLGTKRHMFISSLFV